MIAVVERIRKRLEQDATKIGINGPVNLPALLEALNKRIKRRLEPVSQSDTTRFIIPFRRFGDIR
jgi:hypothetical protein